MDFESADDLSSWVDIVNDAYAEEPYDISAARKHIQHHLFLQVAATYFVMHEQKPVATISVGTYKDNRTVGGDARLAVLTKYQGHGLGQYLIHYGFGQLRERQVRYGESIISIRRDASIRLHFRCGFLPQYRRRYQQYKGQRRSHIIYAIVNLKLWMLYRAYRADLAARFLPSEDNQDLRAASHVNSIGNNRDNRWKCGTEHER